MDKSKAIRTTCVGFSLTAFGGALFSVLMMSAYFWAGYNWERPLPDTVYLASWLAALGSTLAGTLGLIALATGRAKSIKPPLERRWMLFALTPFAVLSIYLSTFAIIVIFGVFQFFRNPGPMF